MGGHSQAGEVARGFWTRLYARAIYLQDANGAGLVLVTCDLWSMPAGLADRVAELVAADPRGRSLGRDQIILAATHTHQSPGNFSSCRLYNEYASPGVGFDPDLFSFLAQRITSAILDAIASQQPARIYYSQTALGLVARNRSFPAFIRDPEAEGILRDNRALPFGPRSPEYPTVEAYHAVDPVLKVLRIEKSAEPAAPIALAGFFSVHPTAMSHAIEFYNSDLFGVATVSVEQTLQAALPPGAPVPIVALFNGAQGDISPAWEQQNRFNTIQIGQRLAHGLTQLLRGGKQVEGLINYRFTNAPLADVAFTDFEGRTFRTADQPLPGAPILGGAEDGRTDFFKRGYIEGLTGPKSRDHGVKLPALDFNHVLLAYLKLRPAGLTRLFVSRKSLPRQVPVGIYKIGDKSGVTLVTLPGEFTLVMGRRIIAEVGKEVTRPDQKVLLVGLANEYVSYFTTPEEYEAQHYEGASMLYGPYAGTLMGYHAGSLARELQNPPGQISPGDYLYSPGRTKRFGVSRLKGQDVRAAEKAVKDVVMDQWAKDFDWEDTNPELGTKLAENARVVPKIGIETLHSSQWQTARVNGIPETNEGLNFLTLVVKAKSKSSTWRVVWMPPPGMDLNSQYRFRVETLDGRVICSDAFRLQ